MDRWIYSPITSAYAMAYSPDGSLMAVAGIGGVQIFSGATGTLLRGFPTRATSVNCVAFSPDGKSLAIGGFLVRNGSDVGVLEVRSVATGVLIDALRTAAGSVPCVAFSMDGKTLASGGGSDANGYQFLELWDVATGTLSRNLITSQEQLYSVAFSPDGKTLADGGYSDTIDLWNYAAGTLANSLPTQLIPVYSVAFSPDGTTLADGGLNYALAGAAELWDVGAGTLTTTINLSNSWTDNSVSFSPDGSMLATCGYNASVGILEIFTTSSGALLKNLATTEGDVRAVAFSPDGTTLTDCGGHGGAAGGGQIEQWGVSGWNLTNSNLMNFAAASVAFSPDGQTLAAGGGYGYGGGDIGDYEITPGFLGGGGVQLWSTSAGALLGTLPTGAKRGVYSIAYSSDDTTLAVGGADNSGNGVLELWNVSTGKLLYTLNTEAKPVNAVAISPDGTTLAVGGGGNSSGSPGVLELWNIAAGTLIAEIATSENDVVACVQFSPDGSSFVAGGSSGDPVGLLEVYQFKLGQPKFNASYYGKDIISCVRMVGRIIFGATWNENTSTVNPPSSGVAVIHLDDVLQHSIIALSASERARAVDPAAAYCLGLTEVSGDEDDPTGFIEWVDVDGNVASKVESGGSGVVSICSTQDISLLAYSDLTSGFVVAVNPYYGTDPVSSVTVTPATVAGGAGATGTVTLSQPAPSGGNVVSFQSSSLSAAPPPSVLVPAGATSATFSITTSPVAATTVSTISASSGFASTSAQLTITTSLAGLAVSPTTVAGGTSAQGTVTLTGPALAGGWTVNLSSSNSHVTVPASVVIPSGSQSATFPVTTTNYGANYAATITATDSLSSHSASLTVTGTYLSGVSASPNPVAAGGTCTGTVTITQPAPTGGWTVDLSSSTSYVGVPASVVIPSGSQSATFPITTGNYYVNYAASIKAADGVSSKTAALNVTCTYLASVSASPNPVIAGGVCNGTVTISQPAPTGGWFVSLTCANPYVGVPGSVTVPAGSTTATFPITSANYTSNYTATITAKDSVSSKSTVLTVDSLYIASLSLNPDSVANGTSSQGTVTLSQPAPTGGWTIQLTSSAPDYASVPASILIPAGSSQGTFTVPTGLASLKFVSSVTITASHISSSKSASLELTP